MLTGDKIRLRATEPSDLEQLLQWENNPDFWQISQTRTPFSRETLQAYLQNSHQPIQIAGQYRFVIETRAQAEAVGTLDFYEYDPVNSRCGVGILIADVLHRQKGYAQEALQIAVKYAFEILLVQQVYGQVLSNNYQSLRLFEKVGFKQTGTRKDWIRTPDGYIDECFLQCFRKDI
jgi:diamine N-acetyltransferase